MGAREHVAARTGRPRRDRRRPAPVLMMPMALHAPRFFATQAAWRKWLAENHAKCAELWVGFWRVSTNRASITWPQSVDEALCFGWIDGMRRGLDAESYMIRFTPRKPGSLGSRV